MKMRRGPCRNCDRLARRVTELETRLAGALARIGDLERQLASAGKDSSTSSKPPSSDIVKPPRPAAQAHAGQQRKRRRGGQPGHERHERTPFGTEDVDTAWIYEWPESSLSADWEPLQEFSTIQQVDLATKLFEVTEHRARLYLHRPTGEVVAAPLPDEVLRAGLVGPRLSALIAYQKGACHMTYRVIETFLADVIHLPLSTGQLAKVVRKASAALASSYAQVQAALPGQAMLNVDETGHPENGQRLWTWGFHAPEPQGFTLFHIFDPRREIPRHPARRGDAPLRRDAAGEDQASVSHVASPQPDSDRAMESCGGAGQARRPQGGAAAAGTK
jgi:transposase